ncbi:importin subunit beta-like isoform X2 [Daphnia carinata]|nr:importin subunit beta-like isoform X2 [Daphnia carinata]
MSIVLADSKNSPVARQAAGLQLKNCLTVRNVSLKEEYQRRWLSLPLKTRKAIRERLISALGTENVYPSCAAQCLAYTGAAELLSSETQTSSDTTSLGELLSVLASLIIGQTASEHCKEAALEALDYVCQEVNPNVLSNYYTSILTPVLNCMMDKKTAERIRLAAARALLSSLECIHPQFETEGGRNIIMQVTCDATQSQIAKESVISFEILVKIALFYYQHLLNYMDQAVVPITLNAIVSTDSNVSLQGIEFWSSVAEIELNLASGVYDPTFVVPESHQYTEKALPKLVPILMEALVAWQDLPNDMDDLEDWSPFKGAFSCLTYLAQCCTNTIDLYIMPEVNNRIKHSDWRQRHAALWAVNAIIEEMGSERVYDKLLPLMAQIWELTNDRNSAKVRYGSHVVMSRIFELCPALIPKALRPLINGLLEHLDDNKEQIAAAACRSLASLVKVVYKLALEQKKGENPITFSLSRYYKTITEKLLRCGEMSCEHLQFAAYQALADILLSSPNDCYSIVKSTIQILLRKLQNLEDRTGEQDFTCGALSRSLARLDLDENVVQLRHEFMSSLLSALEAGVVKEEIFLATSSAISLLGPTQLKAHLPSLITYFKLAVGLPDVLPLIIGLIGDLFRVLGTESLPYLDYFWTTIFDLLNQKDLDTKLCSDCTATLMDMANSVGGLHFQPYIARTLKQLQYIANTTVKNHTDHEEIQENMLKLYTVLFSYTCVDREFGQPEKNLEPEYSSRFKLMQECLKSVSKFMGDIINDETSDMVIIAGGILVGIVIARLGATKTYKYFESNLDARWLLNTALRRADTFEFNSYECQQICKSALSELEGFKNVK